jgi:hypothetical protein
MDFMETSELMVRAREYIGARELVILDLSAPLGFGQDGRIWKTEGHTAIKVFERDETYARELQCYERLAERDVDEICGLSVPKLVDSDDRLKIIEMGTVEPPFLLDFGKAYVDYEPEFSAETLSDWQASIDEMFGPDADNVRLVLWKLKEYGIYYRDAKPGNLMFRPREEF